MDEEDFFAGYPDAYAVHRAVAHAIRQIGAAETRVSRSQIGFYRERAFAATWIPGRHLKGDVPTLALSVFLARRHDSPRWKEIVEPAPGRFTHHMELHAEGEVDALVKDVLATAWREAA